jgi:hypothetical protein
MLRRRTDGENLLEVEEEEGADIVAPTPSIDQGETQSEEGASEQSEEGTSETQSSNEEKSETDEPNKDDAT